MVSMEVPEPDSWHDLVLEPESRRSRGGADLGALPRSLTGRVRMSEPLTRRITAADVAAEDELRAFVEEQEADFAFHMVYLVCTFQPKDDEPVAQAWVEVELARADGGSHSLPIAWSLRPLRERDPVTFSRELEVGFSLKFLQAKAKSGEEATREEAFIEGFGELQPNPAWELRRTKKQDIRGDQQFALIVRRPRDVQSRGTIELTAIFEGKRLGLIPYRGTLPDAPEVAFELA